MKKEQFELILQEKEKQISCLQNENFKQSDKIKVLSNLIEKLYKRNFFQRILNN